MSDYYEFLELFPVSADAYVRGLSLILGTMSPRMSQIGEPERVVEIPDPVVTEPLSNPEYESPNVPDYVPDDFPAPSPTGN